MSEALNVQPAQLAVNLTTATTSPGLFVGSRPWVSAFGNASGACTLTLMYSNDGVTFYASGQKVTLAGAGNFSIDAYTAAPYVALNSSAAVTVTGFIAAKG